MPPIHRADPSLPKFDLDLKAIQDEEDRQTVARMLGN